jgi:precorrin-6A/cobalt-precorrin-6A reductase
MKILILGGTGEARQLAHKLHICGHEVITSLAGRTQGPILPDGAVRMGPFGGVAGLVAYLRAEAIERLVDATHPYAGQMSANAVAAATLAGVPLVRYMRPQWTPLPEQNWIDAASAQEAANILARGAAVLLSTGHDGLEIYRTRHDCRFLLRVIEAPDEALPPNMHMIQSRPPYDLDNEIVLMRDHGITHLVSKNSGGSQTEAKLVAAQRVGVQVIMIARPNYAPAPEVDSVDAVLEALGMSVT